ncbi:MAG: hypothetical protein K6T80_08450 [Firmicutes bacterium]|nr:hypothetical protein [Bacillota bacterium]
MGITFENCLVFQGCAQKTAEAAITVSALNSITGLDIVINPVTREATAVVGGVTVPIAFEACCQTASPFFRSSLLVDKIINCGWVNGAILIRNLDTGVVLACVNLALVFQEEQAAAGVLPTDTITEVVVKDEGSAICIVFSTNPVTGITEPLLIVKCVLLVQKTVTREQAVLPAICPSVAPCPTRRPVCPPDGSNQITIPRSIL